MIALEKVASSAEIAEHYDEIDWIYREIWGEHLHHGLWSSGFERPEEAVLSLVRHVARLARVQPGDRVCDVGCGYGATARLLTQEFGARVTGITLSAKQYERGVASGPERIILGDWLALEVEPRSFDAVLAIESVEHMPDRRLCFRRVRRALRPGGRFVFTTWLAGDQLRGWERRGLLEPICREGRLPGMVSAAELGAWLREEGLEPAQFADLSVNVKRTWEICIRRLVARIFTDARYRRFLLAPETRNRAFAFTPFRMWLAYETEAVRYGLFVCE